jgi:hypothetical protein
LQFSGVIATALKAFQTDEMVFNVAHLTAILAINIACGFGIGQGHGLHSHGGIEKCEVFAHVIGALLTERTRIRLASHVHRKTAEVHDVSAFQSSERFRALEHCLVTDGTIPLQPLRDAMMIVLDGNASVAAHAVIVVDAQSLAGPTNVAERAVIYGFARGVVVEVANVARVPREGLPPRMTYGVDAFIARGLQGAANHAEYFSNLVSVQRRVFVHLASLLAAEPARVQPARCWVAELAWIAKIMHTWIMSGETKKRIIGIELWLLTRPCVMGAPQALMDTAVMVSWCW